MLTRDAILKRSVKLEAVPAPELAEGGTLNVKLLSAAEFLRLTANAKVDGERAYAYWIIATVCDEAGVPLFTTEDLADVTGLPFSLVNRVIDAAQKINGTAEATAGK